MIVLDEGEKEIAANGSKNAMLGFQRSVFDRAGIMPAVVTRITAALGLGETVLSYEGRLRLLDALS